MTVNFLEYSFIMHHLDLHERHYNQSWPVILIGEGFDAAYVLVRSLERLASGKYKVTL